MAGTINDSNSLHRCYQYCNSFGMCQNQKKRSATDKILMLSAFQNLRDN